VPVVGADIVAAPPLFIVHLREVRSIKILGAPRERRIPLLSAFQNWGKKGFVLQSLPEERMPRDALRETSTGSARHIDDPMNFMEYHLVPKKEIDFPAWLLAISKFVRRNNAFIFQFTGDDELQKDPSHVDVLKIGQRVRDRYTYLMESIVKSLDSSVATDYQDYNWKYDRGSASGEDEKYQIIGEAKDRGKTTEILSLNNSAPWIEEMSSSDTLKSHLAPTMQGWMHKASSGILEKFARRYFALWSSSILFYFNTNEQCKAFFQGEDSVRARNQIDLRNVASVRVSNRLDLPGGGKGIEMHTSSRIWLLIPPSDEEFISWLHIITNIVKTNLKQIQKFSGEDELRKDVSHIDVRRLSADTLGLLARARVSLPNSQNVGSFSSTPRRKAARNQVSLMKKKHEIFQAEPLSTPFFEQTSALQRLDLNVKTTNKAPSQGTSVAVTKTHMGRTIGYGSDKTTFPVPINIRRPKMTKPLDAGMTNLDHINVEGWMMKQSGSELHTRFQSFYFALWNSRILYYFARRHSAQAFFFSVWNKFRTKRTN
jgi:hypothetical protein